VLDDGIAWTRSFRERTTRLGDGRGRLGGVLLGQSSLPSLSSF
jgi:hypothetical protein